MHFRHIIKDIKYSITFFSIRIKTQQSDITTKVSLEKYEYIYSLFTNITFFYSKYNIWSPPNLSELTLY